MGLVSLLFSFQGRINRAQYWLGAIGSTVVIFTLVFVLSFSMGASLDGSSEPAAVLGALAAMSLVLVPVFFASSWIGFALQVKRFHDRGRSGLWSLLPFLPVTMIVSTFIGGAMNNAPAAQVFSEIGGWSLLLWAINLGFFIDLACLPGKEGPNKYGNPPGASGGGAPSGIPGRPQPAAPAFSLDSAQSAIDRAIAEQAKAKAGPQQRPAARPTTPVQAPRPAMAFAPAAGASFGRKRTS